MPTITKPYGDFTNNIDVVDAVKINAQANTAYNAINGGLDSTNVPTLGNVATLNTTTKTSVVAAINEIWSPTSRSSFRAYQNAAQSIPANTATKIQFQTKVYDNLTEFDNTTNYRFTANKAGIYILTAAVYVQNTQPSGNRMELMAYVNGSNNASFYNGVVGAATYSSAAGTLILNLAAGDYVEIWLASTNAITTSGSAAASPYVFFEMVRVA